MLAKDVSVGEFVGQHGDNLSRSIQLGFFKSLMLRAQRQDGFHLSRGIMNLGLQVRFESIPLSDSSSNLAVQGRLHILKFRQIGFQSCNLGCKTLDGVAPAG